jgi:hypothetical protein
MLAVDNKGTEIKAGAVIRVIGTRIERVVTGKVDNYDGTIETIRQDEVPLDWTFWIKPANCEVIR